MEPKYRILRIISGIYFIVGVLVLIFGTLGALGTAFLSAPAYAYGMSNLGGTSPINTFVGIAMEVGVLIAGIGFIGIAQLLQLLLRVEENTRTTNENQLEQLRLMRMLVNQGGQR